MLKPTGFFPSLRLRHRACVLIWLVVLDLAGLSAELVVSKETEHTFQAMAGDPFGVATLAVPVGVIPKGTLPRILVTDADQRVFYPTISFEELPLPPPTPTPNPRPILRGGLVDRLRHAVDNASQQVHPPSLLKVQFLFRGKEPLVVDLQGDIHQTFSISAEPWQPEKHRRLLEDWWRGYSRQSEERFQAGDYPPGIEAYLTAMLSSRFEFPERNVLPTSNSKRSGSEPDPMSSIELLAGTDRMRAEIFSAALHEPTQAASLPRVPVPAPPLWQEPLSPEVISSDVAIEPIASRVPPECFYLRFGSFANAMWFRELNQGKGDGLAQMIMRRGLDFQANQRLEKVLNAKTTVLAKLFGDSLISDMAIVGFDFYLQEGPAMGIIFEANSPDLLKTAMQSDREAAAKQFQDQNARLETVKIADVDVSLLRTPDNSIRSFMLQQDKYLIVATSQHLIKRFIEVGRGERSLAVHPIFRQMRSVMPLTNDYSIFAFFSPEFFRNLLSPQYQIEMRRRLSAIVRIQVADMATLCATSEGFTPRSMAELVDQQFLPPWFLESNDDSQPIRDGTRWIDSRRGSHGSMLPIPDVPVVDCSTDEANRYAKLADFYAKSWQQTDPLVLGIRRFADPTQANIEQIGIEAFVAPFGQEKYGWLSLFLAPPVQMQIQQPPDDMVSAQAHLSGQSLLSSVHPPDHVLFVGVKDMTPPPPSHDRRLLETLRLLQQTPAYVGAWPLPGYLDRLPFGLGGGPPDVLGFSKLLIGAWRWQAGGFSVLSFDRAILERCITHLQPRPAEDPAQVRLKVNDLENSQLSSWVNTFWYRRALQASRGNALLLDTVQTQFRIPSREARTVAERLLNGKLQCSLEGEYQLTENQACWVSTAWPSTASPLASATESRDVASPSLMGMAIDPDNTFPPADYRAPWLGWLRGAQLHLTQMPRTLVLVGQLRLEKLQPLPATSQPAAASLPSLNFDLFKAPFQFFKNKDDNPQKSDTEPKTSPPRREF